MRIVVANVACGGERLEGPGAEAQGDAEDRGGHDAGAVTSPIEWEAVRTRLIGFVRRRGLSHEDAEQVAHEAIGRVFDCAYRQYDPRVDGELLRFLGSVANGIIANVRKRPTEAPLPSEQIEALVDTSASPEDEAIAAEYARMVLGELLERTAPDEIVHGTLTLIGEGVTKPTDQAARLGVPIAKILKAKRRLTSHLAAISRRRHALERDDQQPRRGAPTLRGDRRGAPATHGVTGARHPRPRVRG